MGNTETRRSLKNRPNTSIMSIECKTITFFLKVLQMTLKNSLPQEIKKI